MLYTTYRILYYLKHEGLFELFYKFLQGEDLSRLDFNDIKLFYLHFLCFYSYN